MYSTEQVSRIKEMFWLKLGKYMAPIPGANGEKANWINYKTGIKDLFFRMNATRHEALIYVEIVHNDPVNAERLYKQFENLRDDFENTLQEPWQWEAIVFNEGDMLVSRISANSPRVNILKEEDWPLIISFLKPRIILLDKFWNNNRMIFDINI